MVRRLVALSSLALAVPYAPHAHAVKPQQVVVWAGGYLPSEVLLVQGGSLTLASADAQQAHDLVSLDLGPGGSRLFRSDVVSGGQVADVAGVSSLAPSVYPFYCSVHEWMVGNLTVVAPT